MLHGNFKRPCGFTVINKRLAQALAQCGFDIWQMPIDDDTLPLPHGLPDVYLFHGDPYDFRYAPGRINGVFLHWEYLQLPEEWVRKINATYDFVVAPSQPSLEVYAQSGVNLPLFLFSAAVNQAEVHPDVEPWLAPTQKSFRFVHLGGAHARRGTDLLLQAYAEEFSAADDVALILKAFHYEHHRAWLATHLAQFKAPNAPEIVYVHETLPSVVGVFTASDVGVYPLRAECFGLPVLECIASGRRVVVPRGTGLDQFCSDMNADFVRAEHEEAGEKTGLIPSVAHLRRLMRTAYERGKPSRAEQGKTAVSVQHFTWQNSTQQLATSLKQHLRQGPPTAKFDPLPYLTLTNGLPWQDALALENAERELCGVSTRQLTSFEKWACEVAWQASSQNPSQRFTESQQSQRELGRSCHSERSLRKEESFRFQLPERFLRRPRNDNSNKFLFVSPTPFLDGIRPLFEMWHTANLANAELHVVTNKIILTSPLFLRYLVLHDNIMIHEAMSSLPQDDFVALPRMTDKTAVSTLTEILKAAEAIQE